MQLPYDVYGRRREAELIGRRAECDALDQAIAAARAGRGGTLTLQGEPGIGKTALLDYAATHAAGFRLASTNGVQSKLELSLAGLHQLCAGLLDGLDKLPEPQREALRIAFGLCAGSAPDPFLAGLATLGLFSTAGERAPLLCLIDDAPWLDLASIRVLAFLARRLSAEPVLVLFAAREVPDELRGLPELKLGGLRSDEAAQLLATALNGPVDGRVRDQIIAETDGNPLALLALPRGMSAAELAGGFGFPIAARLPEAVQDDFRQRLAGLPETARMFLLLAAADSSGDPALVWRAATILGIDVRSSGTLVENTGLAEFEARIRFLHPLARPAVYRSASRQDRARAHRALARATDHERDPDRRAWHRAQVVPGPCPEVSAELELSAGRAQIRGGLAAAAAFLRRSAILSPDPVDRTRRALAAAEAEIRAGAFDDALDMLEMAEAGPLHEAQQARSQLHRAQLAMMTGRVGDAVPLLLAVAPQLREFDAHRSRTAYLDALSAALLAGRLAAPGRDAVTVAAAAVQAPPAGPQPDVEDLLLDGTVAGLTQNYAAGLPALRAALALFGAELSPDELRRLWLAGLSALRLWDDRRFEALSARYVGLARELGSRGELPWALTLRACWQLMTGDLSGAAKSAHEATQDAASIPLAPYAALGVAALRGDQATVSELYGRAIADLRQRGEGLGITLVESARALLYNGLGQHEDAVAAATSATADPADFVALVFAAAELIEAAQRTGHTQLATETCARLAAMTTVSGTDWALGLQFRCQALLGSGESAERLFQSSIEHLARTELRCDLARAHLLCGEWLGTQGRLGEAREQLRTAHNMFESMGLAAFAQRAGRALRATGDTSYGRRGRTEGDRLTTQEHRIARLARDGLSNPEIATRLFISAHTVQYHLGKVYTKLGVNSRGQLEHALPHETDA